MQLGKYSTNRDCILHYMCTSDWSTGDFGDVEAPTGYVWRISNTWDEVKPENLGLTSLIEDQLAAYDIADTPELRRSLVGHFLVLEDSNGFVSVLDFSTMTDRDTIYSELAREYDAWAGDDEN